MDSGMLAIYNSVQKNTNEFDDQVKQLGQESEMTTPKTLSSQDKDKTASIVTIVT